MIMAGSEDSASKGLAARSRNRSDSRVTPRGEDRRQAIIDAAAAIIRESGPSGVSHRSVAKRAGCSLSATTYYFDGLEDLLHQAGLVNIGLWASRAERVADRVEAFKGVPDLSQRVRFILQATLPAHSGYFGHYLQLISASQAARSSRPIVKVGNASTLRCAVSYVSWTARWSRRWSSQSSTVRPSPPSVKDGTSSPPRRDC